MDWQLLLDALFFFHAATPAHGEALVFKVMGNERSQLSKRTHATVQSDRSVPLRATRGTQVGALRFEQTCRRQRKMCWRRVAFVQQSPVKDPLRVHSPGFCLEVK